MIVECGKLDWATINPDIFGSMFQAVVHKDQRSNMGQHYTSVPNIMKVIEPLFLNELREEFEKHYDNQNKLEQILSRLEKLRIFDPACGSGNFLIIAYKEIRELEMEIFLRIQEITDNPSLPFSRISLSQFYGIELDDFAHEVAILSLWLAEHQMNVKFKEIFGQTNPTLPLREGGNIICGNATRVPWEDVCPKNKGVEVYILGNPPYLGARNQDKNQKADIHAVFGRIKGINSLDYISCWFYMAAKYLYECNGQAGFVTTNSICQGEQVSLLWPNIFSLGIEIGFAHQSFKWDNNAKNKAVVTCAIVGLRTFSKKEKYIYSGSVAHSVKIISPYLTADTHVIVHRRSKPWNNLPSLVYGNQAIEGGNLIIDTEEKNIIINKYPEATKYIRPLCSAGDYIRGISRYCIWVKEEELEDARKILPFAEKFEKVKTFRENGGEVARSLSHIPYRFRYVHEAQKNLLILPRTTSERRQYLPIGFLEAEVIVTDATQVIYDPEPYTLAILSSRIHMAWVKSVAGRLKTDFRYSNSLCYNTFPIPKLTDKQKENITTHVYNVLEERENYSEKTMAELYDPDKMPDGLKEAHHNLDIAVERCYRSKPFTSDEERLEYLFKLYETMIAREKAGKLL